MAQVDRNCLKQLETLREETNWSIKKKEKLRHQILHRFFFLIDNCKGQLPNLQEIFQPREIDWLVGSRDKEGQTLLHLAVTGGNKKATELLLRNGSDPNAPNESTLMTPLHVICNWRNDEESAMFLKMFFDINDKLHQTIDVNIQDNQGRSPLLYAVECHLKKTTASLLRRGADQNLSDKDGSTPLHMICIKGDRKDTVTATFLKFFFDINDELHQPINVDVLDRRGWSTLHYAVQSRLKKTTESLLRRGADQNLSDKDGSTPLHMICNCSDNHTETTMFLKFFFDLNDKVHQLVKVDVLNESNESPLLLALKNKNIEVAEVLLRRGANPNFVDNIGSQPLHLVCNIDKDLKVATFLKIFFKINKNNRVQIDARDERGWTPLGIALNFGHTLTAEVLLRNGANPNLASKKRLTALHLICQSNRIDNFVETFFKICDEKHRKVQIDAQDESGQTPLHIALFRGRKNVVEVLLNRGAGPNVSNKDGSTALHLICQSNRYDNFVETFFKICDEKHQTVQIDAQDESGQTPLHIALFRGRKNVVEVLLNRGAGPNVSNKDGSTALHLICQSNRYDNFVETFFKICDEKHQTVQVDAQDKWGRTPLQFAVANLLPDVVDMLLDRGADLAKFVFPSESLFVQCFQALDGRACKLEQVSRLLVVVERLEKRGYELDLPNKWVPLSFDLTYLSNPDPGILDVLNKYGHATPIRASRSTPSSPSASSGPGRTTPASP
ncbi:unnamed protein product [Trichogramma brassicae]|uniref:Uncharacterized protein n=1 Tax=Trichogramma brassicae TaxID=86971 RepID=A0A6H5IVC4_9HYME|nr:unnamed protein product [Trichogramma brassicae]